MSDKLYIGQDFLITLDTGVNISNMIVKEIWYRKARSSATIKATASLVGTTKLRISIANTTNTIAGVWLFRTYCESATGKKYKGLIARVKVNNEW